MSKKIINDGKAECIISGPLTVVLKISRLIGVAPLRFKKRTSKSWYITISPAICIYGYIILTIMHTMLIMGLVLDLYSPKDKSVRTRTPINQAIWLAELSVVIVVTSICGYGSSKRMKSMIKIINEVYKIRTDITEDYNIPVQKTNIKQAFIIWLMPISNCILAYLDFLTYFQEENLWNADRTIISLDLSFHAEFSLIIMSELQFTYTALFINSALKTLNDCLQQLLDSGDYLQNRSKLQVFMRNRNKNIKLYNFHNAVIDSLGVPKKYPDNNSKRTTAEVVNQLSVSYYSICGLVKKLNSEIGLTLLLTLMCICLHLVITLYHMTEEILSSPISTPGLTNQLFWYMLHFSELLLIVEPCHCTFVEISRTRELVGLFSCSVTSYAEALRHELTMFSWELYFNCPQYSPLGMFTLSRSFITTIIGGVTTYLVIIVQFQIQMAT